MAKSSADAETYSEEETERRVEATLRAALKTPPKLKKGEGRSKGLRRSEKSEEKK